MDGDAGISQDRRVYIGNLSFKATEEDLAKVLHETGAGDFENINMAINANLGHHQGYCFVQFPSREQAEKAIETLGDVAIYGRPLKVGLSRAPKAKTSSMSRPEPGLGLSSWRSERREAGRSEGLGEAREQRQDRPRQQQSREQPREQQDDGSENSRKLYVGGLGPMDDPEEHEQDIREIFAGFNVTSVGKRIARQGTEDANRFFCFVLFDSQEDAEKARQTTAYMEHRGAILSVARAKGREPSNAEPRTPARFAGSEASAPSSPSTAGRTKVDSVRRGAILESANWRSRAKPAADA